MPAADEMRPLIIIAGGRVVGLPAMDEHAFSKTHEAGSPIFTIRESCYVSRQPEQVSASPPCSEGMASTR